MACLEPRNHDDFHYHMVIFISLWHCVRIACNLCLRHVILHYNMKCHPKWKSVVRIIDGMKSVFKMSVFNTRWCTKKFNTSICNIYSHKMQPFSLFYTASLDALFCDLFCDLLRWSLFFLYSAAPEIGCWRPGKKTSVPGFHFPCYRCCGFQKFGCWGILSRWVATLTSDVTCTLEVVA
jgi:hypothetical protein